MSSYGTSGWGTEYYGSPGAFTAAMLDRILQFLRNDPSFKSLIHALALRTEDLLAASKVIGAAFDLDTAVGQQLDRLGAILQRSRLGASDTQYRALLRVQIDLILSSSAGAETILAVFEAITGSAAAEYQEFYPAQFTVGGYVDPSDIALLQTLIKQARGWGIVGGITKYPNALGQTLLGDTSYNPGVWTDVSSDQVFFPSMETLIDVPSNQTGTADGTTYVESTDTRSFNGTTDRLDFDGIELQGSAFSISFWVYFNALAHESRVWSTRYDSGSGSSFISVTTAGAVRLLRARASTNLERVSADSVIGTGTRHHVVVTVPNLLIASQYEIYVDGVEVASYQTTTSGLGGERSTAFGWHLGGRFINDTVNVDGEIGDFRSWARELTAPEAWHVYEAAIKAGNGSFAGPPTTPAVDNPGIGDADGFTHALTYPTATRFSA